ncbi:hypothetical protein EJ110_NYTH27595 [Nymphaea thermarum]|nr:hypothetical protein EJ110_NYTH27595 [Nymphaea thermarum]
MSDPAWQWCTRVNPKDRLRVKCNYCKQIISGGNSRFKHHIAGTHNDVVACNGSQENPLPAYVKHQCQELLDAVKASRIEKEMEDAEEGYGDPHEGEECEGEDVQLEQEDVGVNLGTAKGKGIMHGGGSSATATRKRRGASISSISRGHGRSQSRTGGGRVPTMRSSNMSGSIKNFFPNYTTAAAQPEIRIATQSKDIIEAADETIGRWFYDASIPFVRICVIGTGSVSGSSSLGRGYRGWLEPAKLEKSVFCGSFVVEVAVAIASCAAVAIASCAAAVFGSSPFGSSLLGTSPSPSLAAPSPPFPAAVCAFCAVAFSAAGASVPCAVAASAVALLGSSKDADLDAGSASKAENVPIQVTSIRLTKDNYLSWSAALEIGITSRGRLSYITGDKPAPLKSDPQWATWALEDNQVKVWIISSVSSDIQPLILRKSTSFDMWTVLAKMYGRKKRHLRTYQIKQRDLSVAAFYAALKTKWEELDYHVTDEWKCGSDHSLHWEKEWMEFLFLGGLRDEFEPIRSQILNGDEIPGIEEVYARVESEEQRRQVMHLTTGSVPSAFVSRASGTGQRPARRCTHCNKLGHSADFCWDLHPEKRLVRGRPPSGRCSPSLSDSGQGTPSSGVKTKLSPHQLKELQAYIGRLSTTP